MTRPASSTNDGAVNGGSGTTASNPANGKMDGFSLTAANSQTLLDTLNGVGIEVCGLVKSKLVNPGGPHQRCGRHPPL